MNSKLVSGFAPSAILLLASAIAAAQGIDFAKAEVLTEQLAPGFYTLTGSPAVDPGHPEAAGGRIGVLVGPEGIVMVDATYAPLSDKVVAAIRRISAAPIRFLIDTHSTGSSRSCRWSRAGRCCIGHPLYCFGYSRIGHAGTTPGCWTASMLLIS